MPQMIVQVHTQGDALGAATLAERAVSTEQQSRSLGRGAEHLRSGPAEARHDSLDEPRRARRPGVDETRARPGTAGRSAGIEESFDLAESLGVALDDECSLAELEATLLADSDSSDQIAAAWLYAWAFEAIRPRPADLAAQITSGSATDRALV